MYYVFISEMYNMHRLRDHSTIFIQLFYEPKLILYMSRCYNVTQRNASSSIVSIDGKNDISDIYTMICKDYQKRELCLKIKYMYIS